MQSAQRAGCPPPTSAVTARPAKPRPPWRSAQASARIPFGGDTDEVQGADRAVPEPKPLLPPDPLPQPQPAAVLVSSLIVPANPPTTALPVSPACNSTTPAPSVLNSVQTGAATSLDPGVEQFEGEDMLRQPGLLTALPRVAAVAATAPSSSSAAMRRAPSALSEMMSSSTKPLVRMSGVALSVMVMSELLGQMLYGASHQFTAEELRRALASFDVTLGDVRHVEAAGIISPNLLKGLDLGPPATSGTRPRPYFSRSIADGSLADDLTFGPNRLASGGRGESIDSPIGLDGGVAAPVEPPSAAEWPPSPGQGRGTRIANVVADAAEVAAVAAGAEAARISQASSTVLYGVFARPTPQHWPGNSTGGDEGGAGGSA
ncbi:hypothetical protein Vafri_4248, partial [Volvox africanus]